MKDVLVVVACIATLLAALGLVLAIPAALLWSVLWVLDQFDVSVSVGGPRGPWGYVALIAIVAIVCIPRRRS